MRYWILIAALISCVAQAEDEEALLQPPTLPPQIQSGEAMEEPDITITQDERGEVHEYNVNGKVYKVKVIPSAGPVYYLVDSDGDGELEPTNRNGFDTVQVPMWVLFSW